MTKEEARSLIDAVQAQLGGSMSTDRWARYTEALLVSTGAPRERIKAAVEGVLGRSVEERLHQSR
jgi:hypothetical protein